MICLLFKILYIDRMELIIWKADTVLRVLYI